jgi:hypothetical protein
VRRGLDASQNRFSYVVVMGSTCVSHGREGHWYTSTMQMPSIAWSMVPCMLTSWESGSSPPLHVEHHVLPAVVLELRRMHYVKSQI